jgi:hypothetical protein
MARFRAAAAYLRENPGTTLLLEPKTYYLRDEKARRLQEDVMAGKYTKDPEPLMFNPQFDYVSGIDLRGTEDVCIDGQGASLVFDGFMENFSLQYCKQVTLKNINIDLARKAYSKGTVVGSGEGYTDADFGDQSLLCEAMPTLRVPIFSPRLRRFVNSRYPGNLYLMDGNMKRLGGGVYRLFDIQHEELGDIIHLTHCFHFRPSILIYEAENTVLENVCIHSHCGMGVVGHRSRDILLKGLKIVPSPGEAMSTNTDATHFTSCAGLLRYEGCQFEGSGDDPANIHTYYHTITQAQGNACTAVVKAPTGTHCQKLDYFDPGDTLELTGVSDLTSVRTYRVLESRPDFENQSCDYVLDGDLPENFSDYFLADITQMPRLEVVNCSSVRHRARTFLVKTRDVLIENNFFGSITGHGSAVSIAAEGGWHEGVTSANVVIRNNRIVDCARGISIGISAPQPDKPAHKNITIENNLIDCPDSKHAITVQNVDGLTLRANNLRSGEQDVLIAHCVNVITE